MRTIKAMPRGTFAVLLAAAVVATIEAQKSGGDRSGEEDSPAESAEAGRDNPTAPPRSGGFEVTNLCFTGISITTNGISLSLAWPLDFMPTNSTIDIFAATSLVDSAWNWMAEYDVASAYETNFCFDMSTASSPMPFPLPPDTNAPSAMFFSVAVRTDPDDLRDTDGDFIPDVYEIRNGGNPYVPDYASVAKLAVSPSGLHSNIADALATSTEFSIIELDPAIVHDVASAVSVPAHPVMICSPPGVCAVVRATQFAAFLLGTNVTSRTLFKNLYILLDARSGYQTAFFTGGNVPWNSVVASATFEDIYVRMPNPGVEYLGWLFYADGTDTARLSGCTVNAAGSDWAYGVQAFGSPPLVVENCSFVNFPPNLGGMHTSCGMLLRSSSGIGSGADVSVVRSLFDESFSNAVMFGRLEEGISNVISVSNCIVPRDPEDDCPLDEASGLSLTNAVLSWAGFPWPDSPSVALGAGSLSPVANNPAIDTDGDGLCDYEEIYNQGTDPFLADTDCDGVADGNETGQGTDPSDPHSFLQNLTVSVTNTVSLSHAAYVAYGNTSDTWETNGLAAFPSGFGSTLYTNASAHGAAYIKAFCDLDDDGAFSAATDILLVRGIPHGAAASISFRFGDVDGDGVGDEQEREDMSNPYDAKSLRIRAWIDMFNSDFENGATNMLAITHGPSHWEPDCIVTTFTGSVMSYKLDMVATNGYAYVRCLRDFAGDGDVDNSTNVLYEVNLGRSLSDNPRYTFVIGDYDNDGVSDSDEVSEGTDARKGSAYCLDLKATISRIFVPSNGLSAVAYFGAETNILYGPCVQSNLTLTVDFGHLSTTFREKVTFRFWEDIDGNGVRNAGERQSVLTLPVVEHSMCVTNMMPLGEFDADTDGMPDDWETTHGFSPSNAADAAWDADSDGFMNLHEYWAATDPNDATDDGNGTALYAVTHAVDNRIADKMDNITAAKNIYENYNINMFNTNQVRNTNCWIADIDLTCSSIWNDDPGYHYGDCATLITPQHVVLATHLNSPIGRGYIFRATNGTTTVRRLVDKLRIRSTDITVGLLESPLPAEYTPAKLLPPDYERHLGTGRLIPVLHLNKHRRAFVEELPDLPTWRNRTEIRCNRGSTSQRRLFYEGLYGHDSGSPCFMLIGNERILLYAVHAHNNVSGGNLESIGPHTTLYTHEIKAAVDTMSDNAGESRKVLSFFDFSSYFTIH